MVVDRVSYADDDPRHACSHKRVASLGHSLCRAVLPTSIRKAERDRLARHSRAATALISAHAISTELAGRDVTGFEGRVGVERCPRASRAAGAHRLVSSVPETRPCSATPTGERERSCARRDPASHLEAHRDQGTRGSAEDIRSPRVASLPASRPSAVRRLVWLPAQTPEPLPDPGGQAVPHLHHYLRFRRPRRSGLGRVNAEREARETPW